MEVNKFSQAGGDSQAGDEESKSQAGGLRSNSEARSQIRKPEAYDPIPEAQTQNQI